MSIQIGPCPECGKEVVGCDNAVWLDLPPVSYSSAPLGACWTLMHLGPMTLAAAGDASPEGTGHTLHEHQPEGTL